MGGPAAVGDWAVASICIVKDAQGAVGGAHQLAIKNRPPQWQAALGILQKGRPGTLTQPCPTQNVCHIQGV